MKVAIQKFPFLEILEDFGECVRKDGFQIFTLKLGRVNILTVLRKVHDLANLVTKGPNLAKANLVPHLTKASLDLDKIWANSSPTRKLLKAGNCSISLSVLFLPFKLFSLLKF